MSDRVREVTPDRAAAERVAQLVVDECGHVDSPNGACWLCITTALLTWGAQRWREGVEHTAREILAALDALRSPSLAFGEEGMTAIQYVEDQVRALLPPPGEGTP